MTARSRLDDSVRAAEFDAEILAMHYEDTGLSEPFLRQLQDQLDGLPMPRPPAKPDYDCW